MRWLDVGFLNRTFLFFFFSFFVKKEKEKEKKSTKRKEKEKKKTLIVGEVLNIKFQTLN